MDANDPRRDGGGLQNEVEHQAPHSAPAGPASLAFNLLPAEAIDQITWSLSRGADDYVDTGVTPVPSNHPNNCFTLISSVKH